MSRSPQTLSPALAAYVLVACLILFLASGGVLWFLAVLGAAIAGSYILRVRLPLIWLPSLLLAGLLLGLAILLTPVNRPTAMIGDVRATLISGQAMGILALIQFYRPVPRDPARPSLIALLAGSFILLGACSTYEENLMRVLVPVAVLLGGVALRATRHRHGNNPLSIALVGLALCVSFGISAFGVSKANEYREALSDWGNRLIGDRQMEATGMALQPTLGPLFGLRGSTVRVLRLEGRPRSSHLRGLSYDNYHQGRWWPVVPARGFRSLGPRELAGKPIAKNQTRRVSVTLLSSDNFYLYAPLNTVGFELSDVERIDWASEAGGPLRVRVSLPYTYIYEEGPESLQGLLSQPSLQMKGSESRLEHLKLPAELEGALLPLAKRITSKASTPAGKVEAITQYLLKKYPYSLRFSVGQGDPVVHFLTQEPPRGAHCELFASSAALLLRCVGIPTRYVTGYFAHETQEDGSVLVRQRDAHAWCEAWVEGTGWVLVEATPPTGRPDSDTAPVELWRRAWEGVQDLWLHLLGWLASREPWELFLVAVIPILLVGMRQLYRRRQVSLPAVLAWRSPPLELKPYATRFEAVLIRWRGELSPTLPWSEQLSGLPDVLFPPALRFIDLYSEARFGYRLGDASELESILQELEKMQP